MLLIGLLGGVSCESTSVYYALINESVRRKLGGLHSARVLVNSIDFHQAEALRRTQDWQALGIFLSRECQRLESAGAQVLAVCSNTMHAVFETIERSGNAPMIHIADAMFREICRSNVSTVGLLGTKHTMSSTSYRDRLSGDSELGVLVPYEPDQALINAIIYEELCVGIISDESRRTLLRAADNLVIRGAQVIIAGCTELNLLIRPEDLRVPLLDTTAVHVDALVAAAFQEQF